MGGNRAKQSGSIWGMLKTAAITAGVLIAVIAAFFAFMFFERSAPAHVSLPAPVPAPPLTPSVSSPAQQPIDLPMAVATNAAPIAVADPKPLPVELVEVQKIAPPRKEIFNRIVPARPPLVVTPGIRRAGVTNAPNPYATFKTTSERVMSQLLRTPPGFPVLPAIPLGPNFDQDFAESLKNMIVIYETDTPEEENHKLSVGWMKEEMRKMVEEGESPTKIVTEYRNYLNEVAALRTEMQRQVSAFKKADNIQAAEAYAAEANKILETYGAKPLVVNPVIKRRVQP